MRQGLTLFTYLHLAADKACTDALLDNKVTGIAYETVQLGDGSLPLLAPMSEVAGRLGPQVGAYHLMRSGGGYGALLGGVPGTYASKVVVIGGGVSGLNAAQIAVGMGAHVTVLDRNIARLRQHRRDLPGPDPDRRVQRVRDREGRARGRPGHRRGAGHRGQGAQAGLQRARLPDEARLGPGRHRDRPGRLLRGLAPDHARRPGLQGPQQRLLLRRQHARRGAAHLDLRADQRDPAVRGRACRQRLARRPRADKALARGLNTHEGKLTNAPVAQAHGYQSVTIDSALA